uniref:Endonuclease/exonuclease/phosphatase domain-containing protein n=1 Tax=Brassica oleracea var. oleracea TaxID=109376 RepID=A0A0D3C302_BRAOL
MAKLYPGWNFVSNHLSDEDGRIILIWKHPLKVQFVNQSSQSITCILQLPNSVPFYYTAVYASNLTADRSDLWTELLCLHDSLDLQNYCWIVGGDFNQILTPSEHSSPTVNAQDLQMYQFQDCLLQTGLFDLRYNGPCHTWKNSQPDMPIAKKLDRLLTNCNTILAYPHATAIFLPPDISDHTPCLLDLAFQLPKAGTQPFKFQNYLTKHPEFTMVIHDAWSRAGSNCWTLTQLCWKLKLIKIDLKLLNRDNFSKIQESVK